MILYRHLPTRDVGVTTVLKILGLRRVLRISSLSRLIGTHTAFAFGLVISKDIVNSSVSYIPNLALSRYTVVQMGTDNATVDQQQNLDIYDDFTPLRLGLVNF